MISARILGLHSPFLLKPYCIRHLSIARKPLNVAFFGSDEVSLPTLKRLHQHRSSVVDRLTVVCPPEKPKGRDRVPIPGPVKAFSVENGIDVHQPPLHTNFKLEGWEVGVMLFAIIMSMTAIMLLSESINKIVEGLHERPVINMDAIAVGTIIGTIIAQVSMGIYCQRISKKHNENASAAALAQDHYNDVCVNIIGGTPAMIAGYWSPAWFMDPVGAIGIALYIGARWTVTCLEQINSLVGKTAPPQFIQQLIFLTAKHDRRIMAIDTVLAYHIGSRYQVEVHIALPGTMALKEAHDIGESLEKMIEQLPDVERAFVHLDYETEHAPEHSVMGPTDTN